MNAEHPDMDQVPLLSAVEREVISGTHHIKGPH